MEVFSLIFTGPHAWGSSLLLLATAMIVFVAFFWHSLGHAPNTIASFVEASIWLSASLCFLGAAFKIRANYEAIYGQDPIHALTLIVAWGEAMLIAVLLGAMVFEGFDALRRWRHHQTNGTAV